jgi:hypothetical protein
LFGEIKEKEKEGVINMEIFAEELKNLLDVKAEPIGPYVFRTRLERLLLRIRKLAEKSQNKEVLTECTNILNKFKDLSDKSNQTNDGTPQSLNYLRESLECLRLKLIKE